MEENGDLPPFTVPPEGIPVMEHVPTIQGRIRYWEAVRPHVEALPCDHVGAVNRFDVVGQFRIAVVGQSSGSIA